MPTRIEIDCSLLVESPLGLCKVSGSSSDITVFFAAVPNVWNLYRWSKFLRGVPLLRTAASVVDMRGRVIVGSSVVAKFVQMPKELGNDTPVRFRIKWKPLGVLRALLPSSSKARWN